ncbi:hypothetical protein OBBRIDRAFT_832704 [Obba rivulosa]|uniref:Calponin-homology (CH) domain-containing protein n=1 Tax=Obba rivulosa TaxID=1052685 RepID=A0A8E2DPE6_9APHY|nr:hypothetical protein OBBRIDRAFT_832704 [Obba rivulosa]
MSIDSIPSLATGGSRLSLWSTRYRVGLSKVATEHTDVPRKCDNTHKEVKPEWMARIEGWVSRTQAAAPFPDLDECHGGHTMEISGAAGPGLEPLDEKEAKDYGAVEDFDVEGEHAHVFMLWLNSLVVEPGVLNLLENLKDDLRAKPGVKPIRSLKDPSLTTGLFLLDLLEAIRPGIVDPSLIINVRDTRSYEDRRQNAKLAISIARKMNAQIFLVLRQRRYSAMFAAQIMTFVSSLMSIANK